MIDQITTWRQAAWALLMTKADLKILNKAGGGRFKLDGWSFAYKSEG